MENIKEAEVYSVTTVNEYDVVSKDENDSIKEALMKKILGENVAVSVGNYIFIPPLANPKVTSPNGVINVMQQDNYSDNYVTTRTVLDDQEVFFVTHISRIVHEGDPVSVNVHTVDKFNEDDIKTMFQNEIPQLFVKTVSLLQQANANAGKIEG